MTDMIPFPPALGHGLPVEVFPNIFMVTGSMETVLNAADWSFSRNMVIVRQEGELTLVNTIRLDPEGLEALNGLGTVRHVLRLGALHGRDDGFYQHTFGAKLWAPEGVNTESSLTVDHRLREGCACPLQDGSIFGFRTSKLPELILHLDRHGGILISCDALQNWERADPYFSEETRLLMADLGYFQRANFGPLWRSLNDPSEEDFLRLEELSFDHVLCGHGQPLLGGAKAAFTSRRMQVYQAGDA